MFLLPEGHWNSPDDVGSYGYSCGGALAPVCLKTVEFQGDSEKGLLGQISLGTSCLGDSWWMYYFTPILTMIWSFGIKYADIDK